MALLTWLRLETWFFKNCNGVKKDVVNHGSTNMIKTSLHIWKWARV